MCIDVKGFVQCATSPAEALGRDFSPCCDWYGRTRLAALWEPRPDDPIFPQPDRSMYHGGEFKEKLTLITYVGNQDGQMHDMVEILASGEVLSGGDSISKEAGDRIKVIDSTFPWYVKPGCSSLGLFFGLYFRLRFPFQEAKW
jgi:hypothetical protein